MSENTGPVAAEQPEQPAEMPRSPSDIADMSYEQAAAALKQFVQGKPMDIDRENLGQFLSPDTPGRGR